jgi:hypothetical protein
MRASPKSPEVIFVKKKRKEKGKEKKKKIIKKES